MNAPPLPVIVAALITLWMRPLAAWAQGAAPTNAPAAAVTPPQLQRDPGVAYPEDALRAGIHDIVTVSLIVDVDASGAVRSATVEMPQGHGFDEAAVAAAQALVFAPAQRAGTPIAARIRFHYVFEPPAPRLIGRVLQQPSDAPVAGALVRVHDAAGGDHVVTADADGSFSLDKLPPGPAQVAASGPGLEPLTTEESLTPGEETNLVLRLTPPAPAAAPPPAPGAEQVVEVTVRGVRPPREVTRRTLSRDEIEHIPGTNGDALRALQSMPGVARPPLLSTGLIVRGAAPQDTRVFVDGTNIPLVYHFAGLSSVVPTELLEKIDFYPSNFSAMYGRGTGGMIDIGLRDPRTDRLHGIGQADLIDTRLVLEGPLGAGWSFLAAGRRSWFDVWLTPLVNGGSLGLTTAPVYYDYQAMIKKDLGSHESVRLVFFGSDDVIAILNKSPNASDPAMGGDLNAHTAFWRAQARYQTDWDGGRTSLRALASYGFDSTSLGSGARFREVVSHPLSGRLELSQQICHGVTANVGLDLLYESYDLHLRLAPQRRPGQPDLAAIDTPVEVSHAGSRLLPGAYTEWEITPAPGLRIVPGVRLDHDDATKRWDLAPRLSARLDLTHGFPRTTLKAGAGLVFQPPTPLETDPVYGQPGLRSNRAIHYDLGLEQDITPQIELSVDGFAKSLDRLVVPGGQNLGSGYVYGVETLVRYKADERFFGWLSYTLSRSMRRDLPSDPLRLFQYDQTHVLTVLGGYKLGHGWQVGARFRLISGPLDTTSSYGAYDATAGAQLSVDANPPYGQRLPLFHQLDLRVDKRWTFDAWNLTGYLDIQNVYSNQSPESLSYNYNFTQSTYAHGLPILPSLGLRAEF